MMIYAIYYAPIRQHESWEEEPVDIFNNMKDAIAFSKTMEKKPGFFVKIKREKNEKNDF